MTARTAEAAKREIAKQRQQHHQHHTTPQPPPPPLPTPQHLTANNHRGIPLSKKSYGYKFISEEEAAAAAEKREEKKSAVRENSLAANGRDETRVKHEEGAKHSSVGESVKESEEESTPPTMEKLAKLPINDAVRLAIRYKLLDHLPALEGAPLAEWGKKGGVDADVKAALTYTLYDHPLLGNRDAAASHSVGLPFPVAGQVQVRRVGSLLLTLFWNSPLIFVLITRACRNSQVWQCFDVLYS